MLCLHVHLIVVVIKVKKHVNLKASREVLAFATRPPSHRDVLGRIDA